MGEFQVREDHILPTVRIHKIVLENFKSVKHGEVVFACAKKFIPQDTCSDILGIYGQNGSGKTAVIEALSILKRILSGRSIPPTYAECIAVGAPKAHLEFTFDFQYPDPKGCVRTIVYSFDIDKVASKPEDNVVSKAEETRVDDNARRKYPYEVRVSNESVSAKGYFNGNQDTEKHTIINSIGGKGYPIGPVSNLEPLVGKHRDDLEIDLMVYKKLASERAKSFIFCEDTMSLLYKNSGYSEEFQVLLEMLCYGVNYLYVIDTRAAGGRDKVDFPLNTRRGRLNLSIFGSNIVTEEMLLHLDSVFSNINIVLDRIIPGLQVIPQVTGTTINSDGLACKEFVLISKRDEMELPLRDESDGIIKLVSILSLITAAYNDRSCTVAVDELDSGIFEYLLGEILIGLEEYGKGQFIFTSHNLRPLEVLKKEELIFTTSNPDNRYIRLKGVGKTNNLRDLYLREIVDKQQDEIIYDASKRFKMVSAFKKAGTGYGEEE